MPAQPSNPSSLLASVASSLPSTNAMMTAMIRDVTLRSQFTPSYTWTPTAQPSPPGGLTGLIMRAIRPTAEIRLPTGGVMTVAPWGVPTSNYFPLLALSVLGLGVLVAGSLVMLGRRMGG